MKTTEINLDKLSVMEDQSGYLIIVDPDIFKDTPYCECYDDHGYKIGCEGAECYSITNQYSHCKAELLSAIKLEFPIFQETELELIGDEMTDYELDKYAYSSYSYTQIAKINRFIREWLSENTKHTIVKAHDYFDGHNWQSAVVHASGGDVHLDYTEVSDDVKKRVFSDFKKINPDNNMVIGKRTIAHGEEFRFEFEESAVPFDHIKAFDIDDFYGDHLDLEDAFKDAILEVEGFPENMIVDIWQHGDGSYSTGNRHEKEWKDRIKFYSDSKIIGHVNSWSVDDYDFREDEIPSDRQKALAVYDADGSEWYREFLQTFNLN